MRDNPVPVSQGYVLSGPVGDVYRIGEGKLVFVPSQELWLCDYLNRYVFAHIHCLVRMVFRFVFSLHHTSVTGQVRQIATG